MSDHEDFYHAIDTIIESVEPESPYDTTHDATFERDFLELFYIYCHDVETSSCHSHDEVRRLEWGKVFRLLALLSLFCESIFASGNTNSLLF